MTTFQWTIVSMPAYAMIDGQSDVVFEVNWACQAMEGKMALNAVTNGSVPVTYTAGSPFTPYDQLTEDQVWGWINPSIDRPAVEANLQAMLAAQQNPEVVTPPLPWSN